MSPLKAKQLDVTDLANAIIYVLNTDASVRDTFVTFLNTYAPDKKVKADSADPNIAGFLIDKVEEKDTILSGISTTVQLKNDSSKVVIGTIVDYDKITTNVINNILKIRFTVTTDSTTYINTSLIGKSILILSREGFELSVSTDPDGFQFNNTTGTVTFNTILTEGERINILAG